MLDSYKEFTREIAVYPEARQRTLPAITYTALGLAGEAGEVANKVKKLLRDGDTPEKRAAIGKEMGDILWYWVRLCDELSLDPVKVLEENQLKLTSRKERGTLQGSGDNR